MLELIAITLLSALAALLNAYAARIADRSSTRRARLEDRWGEMAMRDREAV